MERAVVLAHAIKQAETADTEHGDIIIAFDVWSDLVERAEAIRKEMP